VSDSRSEYQKGNKIENGSPDDGLPRVQDPGGDDGGDGVGRIMHAVGEVESQGDEDDEDD
jgi:hypothetical protein